MKKSLWLLSFIFLIVISGCSTTKVTRVDANAKIDFSGQWNDYDAMLVSQELVEDCLSRTWQKAFIENRGRNPVVIVGHVSNRTQEHIDAQIIVKYLERELLNSGKVVFVANPVEREGIRAEREDQQKGYTSTESMLAMGKERGADYMLIGNIGSIKDEIKRQFSVFYQVNLELIDLATNEKVWIGQKQIKKKVKQPRFSL